MGGTFWGVVVVVFLFCFFLFLVSTNSILLIVCMCVCVKEGDLRGLDVWMLNARVEVRKQICA